MSRKFFNVRNGINLGAAASDPSDGKAGSYYYNTVSNKIRFYNGTVWANVGSGSGSGINFATLDTNGEPNVPDNFDFEGTEGNTAAYADAAGTEPVDMTGGSPNITRARTTTSGEILDGRASLKIVKDAANRQGQGVAWTVNVPVGYQGAQGVIKFPWKTIVGGLVDGDVNVAIYDVTNSKLLQIINRSLIGTQGLIEAGFHIPPCATSPANLQLRVGIHFASTSTSAVTLLIDDFIVTQASYGSGAIDGPTVPELDMLPAGGFGTVTVQSIKKYQHGDKIVYSGDFETPSVSGSDVYIQLPPGIKIKPDSVGPNGVLRGRGNLFYSGVAYMFTSNGHVCLPFCDGVNFDKIYFATRNSGSNSYLKEIGTNCAVSGGKFGFEVEICVDGLQGSNTVTDASTFNISSILTTRVTTDPVKLGEYRTYIKSSSSFAGTDNAPTNAPSVTNGMEVYSVPYASAGTSGQPNRWEIFIGKNKNYQLDFYASAAKTGALDAKFDLYASDASCSGAKHSYDETTGILTIDFMSQTTGTSNRYVGWTIPSAGAAYTQVSSGYFDVKVSDNPRVNLLAPNWRVIGADLEGTTTDPSLGTPDVDKLMYYIDGKQMSINWTYDAGSGVTDGSGTYILRLPEGKSFAPDVTTNTNKDLATVVGHWDWLYSGTSRDFGFAFAYDANHMAFAYHPTIASSALMDSTTTPFTAWNNFRLKCDNIPIA